DTTRQEIGHPWPQFLPDGRHYIYVIRSARPENVGIYVGALDSTKKTRLLDIHAKPVYAESAGGVGYLLFQRDSTIAAQQFEATKRELRGKPFPVAEHVPTAAAPWPGYGVFTASHNGVLAYGTIGWEYTELVWLDRQGRRVGSLGEPAEYSNPALSR